MQARGIKDKTKRTMMLRRELLGGQRAGGVRLGGAQGFPVRVILGLGRLRIEVV